MRPSLDPEIFMAKLLCKFAGTDSESLVRGGYDEGGAYYPHFTQMHLFDHRIGEVSEVYAWRKYVLHARKLIEEMTRNGQSILQARPKFYHGDREEVGNYWIGFWTDMEPEDFQTGWPHQLLGALDGGWKFHVAIQARSEKEAVGIIFDSFVGEADHIRILFLEPKPNDWSPFNGSFEREDWMRWDALATKE